MQKRWIRGILWAAVLAIAAMIFLFSSESGEESLQTSGRVVDWLLHWVDPGFAQCPADVQQARRELCSMIVRKGAHFSEYALLGALLYLLCRSYGRRSAGLLAWLAGTGYAGTDELHQLLVSARSGSLADVGIDSLGVCTGALLATGVLALMHRARGRRKSDRADVQRP